MLSEDLQPVADQLAERAIIRADSIDAWVSLFIRSNTERREVIEAGIARLVGESAEQLRSALVEAEGPTSWASRVGPIANPFGRGDSAILIADAVLAWAARRPMEAGLPEMQASR